MFQGVKEAYAGYLALKVYEAVCSCQLPVEVEVAIVLVRHMPHDRVKKFCFWFVFCIRKKFSFLIAY